MRQKLIAVAVILFTFTFAIPASHTAPALAVAKKVLKKGAKSSSGGALVGIRALRGKRGVVVTFSGLSKLSSVSYVLSYQNNGEPTGVVGTLKPGRKNSLSRELLFGTCSSGVCNIHRNIKKAKLEVTSILKSGKRVSRSYPIRL